MPQADGNDEGVRLVPDLPALDDPREQERLSRFIHDLSVFGWGGYGSARYDRGDEAMVPRGANGLRNVVNP